MRSKAFLAFIPCILLGGCNSQFPLIQGTNAKESMVIEDLRSEIAEIKQTVSATDIALQLVEEKMEHPLKMKMGGSKEEVAALHKRLVQIEKNQEKISGELKNLTKHAHDTTAFLSHLQQRADLTPKKADDQRPLKYAAAPAPISSLSSKPYRIKAGDSLEKIARNHHVSIEYLKKINSMENDLIKIGQEIQIPDGD